MLYLYSKSLTTVGLHSWGKTVKLTLWEKCGLRGGGGGGGDKHKTQ